MPGFIQNRRLLLPGSARYQLLAEYAVNGDFSGITTSRAGPLWLPDASGALIEYASGNVGIVDGDAVWSQPEAENLVPDSTDATQWTSISGATQTDTATTANSGLFKVINLESAGGTPDRYEFVQGLTVGDGDVIAVTLYLIAGTSGKAQIVYRDVTNGNNSIIDGDFGSLSVTLSDAGAISDLEELDVGFATRVRFKVTQSGASSDVNIGVGPFSSTVGEYVQALGAQAEADNFTSFIETSGGSDTAGPTKPVIPWPSGLDSTFAGSFVWKPAVASQGTVWLLGNYSDADNAFGVLHNGTNIIFRNRVSGSNNDATKALAYSANTEYLIHFRHDSITGLDVAVDRTKGTNDSTTTAVTAAANCEVGSDGNTANHTIGKVKEIKIQKTYPGFSDAAWLAL